MEDSAAYNKAILNWGYSTRTKLKYSISRLSMKGKGDLMRSLITKTRWNYGEIDRLEFSFVRHGVFLHKGVGRGYFIQGGKVIRGYKHKDLSGLFAKRGEVNGLIFLYSPIRRHPKQWFTSVIDKELPVLVDNILIIRADLTIRAISSVADS